MSYRSMDEVLRPVRSLRYLFDTVLDYAWWRDFELQWEMIGLWYQSETWNEETIRLN